MKPNALAKSFFVGNLADKSDDPEFYTATTLVDVPYGADQGGPFPGLVAGMKRIKWEIAEDQLIARQTYEIIDGVDGHGARTTNNGQIVAAYTILEHFDIRRAYNSQTGEESNVIEENSSDRPWYEREYMRVDWSVNLVTSSIEWDPLAGDSYETEPLAYNVTDPSDPDAPVFVPEEGYFDVTNRIVLAPKMIDLGDGSMPACYYRGSLVIGATYPWGNCEQSQVTVRVAFRRIPQRGEPGFTDFEPMDWDGERMNAFGVFTVQRLGWDDNYGIVDDKFRRFAQKYNIWQKSHSDVACGISYSSGGYPGAVDTNNDGTDDGCEAAGAGSRCDGLVGKCTIPFRQRELRPVAWHYTFTGVETDPKDAPIYDSTEWATWEWDTALRIAVQAARRVECIRTHSASPEDCATQYPIQQHDDAERDAVIAVHQCTKGGKDQATCVKELGFAENSVAAIRPMVVLCHAPVAAGDDPACGPVGTRVRPGDIRYHQINMWPTRHSSSPWGYGPSLSDPLTGEIISAGINVYNAVTDSAAQSFLDTIRWFNGELSITDISSAKHVHDWVASHDVVERAATGGPTMSRDEIKRRISGIAHIDPQLLEKSKELRSKIDHDTLQKLIKQLDFERLPPGAIPEDRSKFEARIERAKASPVEAELMNPMWLQMAAVPPDTPFEEKLEKASPLRGMSSTTIRLGERKVHRELAEKGQCMVGAPEPTGIPALAKVMQKKFPLDPAADAQAQKDRLDSMLTYLRTRMNYSVILHEMGHTIGLRHNFVSTYDRFNFRPQYWQLRTHSADCKQEADGTCTPNPKGVREACDGQQADGSNCLGPRYFDPLDQEEIDNGIWMWQHTTVMDYPGDLTQDMMGLGVYDYAAARMFYGDVVDVIADPSLKTDVRVGDTLYVKGTELGNAIDDYLVDRIGSIFGQFYCKSGGIGGSVCPHYSLWNNDFQFIRNCRKYEPQQPSWWDEKRDGKFDPVFDGKVVKGEVCDRMPVDYVAWRDMVPDVITDALEPDYIISRRAKDYQGRPRMPYGFESDEYADGWAPASYRHDNGADLYEELVFHTNIYENRHIFDNYRNGRVNFTVYGAYNRALSRYHEKIANLTQGFAYSVNFILKEFAQTIGVDLATVIAANAGEGAFLFDHAVASSVGFDHFVRVMTRPHTGQHYQDGNVLKPIEDVIGNGALENLIRVTIPNGNMIAGGDLSYGGRSVNNDFQYDKGYWTIDYLDRAGSYYEKTFAIERMFEASYGAINFFRWDGIDARFRHINFADLYPEGMRRLVGAMLTEDVELYGPRVPRSGNNVQTVEVCPFINKQCSPDELAEVPAKPLAWASYVANAGPEVCAPQNGSLVCSDLSGGGPWGNDPSQSSFVVDPQLGYEVQKFIVFWAYVYQSAMEQWDWVDLMRIYRLGSDTNPDYLPDQYVEWRDPESGLRYLARKYGDEVILGKTYDKGIAAKMIQWANRLTGEVYELDPVTPFDPVTGRANVLFDANGQPILKIKGAIDPAAPVCDDNPQCEQLRNYRGLMDFVRDTAAYLGFPEPALQIFGD